MYIESIDIGYSTITCVSVVLCVIVCAIAYVKTHKK